MGSIRSVHCIWCAWFLFYVTAQVAMSGTPVDVYVLCGQSNMFGSGVVSLLNEEYPGLAHQEDVLYWYELTSSPPSPPNHIAAEWGPLRELSAVGPSFGLELAFGRAVADASSTQVAILKTAVNGASINSYTPQGSGAYWTHLSVDAVAAIAELQTLGYEPTVRAFVWVQGSSDANSATRAPLYQDQLEDLATAVRGLWGDQLLFVQSQQYCCGPFPQEQIDAVRDAKQEFTDNDAHATLAPTDDLDMRPDQIHFGWRSLLTLGDRLAGDLLTHIPEDLNGDGLVDTADLGILIGDFGTAGRNRADLNLDRVVDTADLGLLLSAFGSP